MDDRDTGIRQWEFDNPAWLVVGVRLVISTVLTGEVLAEIEVQVQHRETGELLSGAGFTVAMALAMVDYLISERH